DDVCFFFFSSRRRHTRSKRDWSSDVCSSDLTRLTNDMSEIQTLVDNNWILDAHKALEKWFITATTGDITAFVDVQTRVMALAKRSEERRVGKECRSRW